MGDLDMDFFFSGFVGGVHTLSAMIALVVGGKVFFEVKGTSLHRVYGYIYVVAMLVLNVSAIPLQNLFGGVGWFHLFILISLPYLIWGMYYPLFDRENPKWQIYHYEIMSYSYVGLVAAFVAEVFIRVPLALGVDTLSQFVLGVFIVSGIAGALGYGIVVHYKPNIVRRYATWDGD